MRINGRMYAYLWIHSKRTTNTKLHISFNTWMVLLMGIVFVLHVHFHVCVRIANVVRYPKYIVFINRLARRLSFSSVLNLAGFAFQSNSTCLLQSKTFTVLLFKNYFSHIQVSFNFVIKIFLRLVQVLQRQVFGFSFVVWLEHWVCHHSHHIAFIPIYLCKYWYVRKIARYCRQTFWLHLPISSNQNLRKHCALAYM